MQFFNVHTAYIFTHVLSTEKHISPGNKCPVLFIIFSLVDIPECIDRFLHLPIPSMMGAICNFIINWACVHSPVIYCEFSIYQKINQSRVTPWVFLHYWPFVRENGHRCSPLIQGTSTEQMVEFPVIENTFTLVWRRWNNHSCIELQKFLSHYSNGWCIIIWMRYQLRCKPGWCTDNLITWKRLLNRWVCLRFGMESSPLNENDDV